MLFAGTYHLYAMRTVLSWFGNDKGKSRKRLRVAMKELNLGSRPDSGSASIRSNIIFFSKSQGASQPPASAGVRGRPNISEVKRKFEEQCCSTDFPGIGRPPRTPREADAETRAAPTLPKKTATPAPSWMQLLQEVRQALICAVCDEEIPTHKRDRDTLAVALFGAADFGVSCCCLQTVSDNFVERVALPNSMDGVSAPTADGGPVTATNRQGKWTRRKVKSTFRAILGKSRQALVERASLCDEIQ
jgi:hypothetical protein